MPVSVHYPQVRTSHQRSLWKSYGSPKKLRKLANIARTLNQAKNTRVEAEPEASEVRREVAEKAERRL